MSDPIRIGDKPQPAIHRLDPQSGRVGRRNNGRLPDSVPLSAKDDLNKVSNCEPFYQAAGH
jgi:hypothetical protein